MQAKRTVLVTGGARRVGRSIVEAFAGTGADVAIHYRSSKKEAEELARRVRHKGVACRAFGADLTVPQAAQSLIDSVIAEFGTIDVLVNSAASFIHASFCDSDDETWERAWRQSLDTNLVAPARLVRFCNTRIAAEFGGGCQPN